MKNKIFIIAILLCINILGYTQTQNPTTGKVIDKMGNPVSGVLVSNSRLGISASTDKDGIFSFSVPIAEGEKLEVKTSDLSHKTVFIGKTEEPVIIVMDYTSTAVDMGFNFTQTIAQSTAAISSASVDRIDKRSASRLSNSLFGNVLGLTTLQNAALAWETPASFSIRGLKTLSNNGLLILVDGFERPIDNLTMNEVESVSILRDAAAVALYGYKGINGIVSVKTKRGKYDSKEIRVSYDHGFIKQYKKPNFVDSYTYAKAVNEAMSNDGLSPRYSANEIEAYRSGKYPYLYPNVNWFDEVFKPNGSSNIFDVSFRGGSKKVRYFTLMNLQTNSGFIKHANWDPDHNTQMKYSKANLRTNLDVDITPTTQMEVNILGILEENQRPGLNSDNMMTSLFTTPSAAFPVRTYDGVWGGNPTWGRNPAALARARGYTKSHNRGIYADVKLKQNLDFLTEGLKASARIGYDNYAKNWEQYTKQFVYGSDAVNMNTGVPTDTVRYLAGQSLSDRFSKKLDAEDRHFNFVGTIDYARGFGQHDIMASLIYSYENQVKNGQHNTFFRHNMSLYLHYGWAKKYYADLTMVLSGSNRLAKNHKYALSPTLSAAWIASNESFMKDVKFIDFLKVRASFGIINADFIPSQNYWNQTLVSSGGYPFGDSYGSTGGITEGLLPALTYKNEKAYKYNIGLDAVFLKDFTFTIDGYFERRSNIYVSTAGSLSSTIGGNIYPAVNDGKVDSYGFEAGIDFEKQIDNVTVFAGGKFTLSKNKIKEMLEEPKAYEYLKQTGRPIGQLFGLQAIGYFIDQNDIDHSPTQQFSGVKPGDIKYRDVNGDGIINEFDIVPIGKNISVPEIYFSFDLGFEWKGLGANATFQGVGNYSKTLSTPSQYQPLINSYTISNHYYKNRWTPDNPNAKYPRLTTQSNDNNFRNNTVWLADASYLKLRNCEIYYKFPKSLIKSLKMDNAKLYLRGIDLFSIDNMDISDPESVGINYPMTRSAHIGFVIGF